MLRTRCLPLLACVCLGVCAHSQTTFSRPLMFDFDQKRNTLPNNGDMHCVPTAYTDLFMYMAANGMPGMDSGFGTGYTDVSTLIFLTGIGMGTNSEGTNFSLAWDYSTNYVNSNTSKLVYHFGYGPDWNWGINKIRAAVRMGSVVRIGYGRYIFNVNHDEWERYSGHAVVVSGYDWSAAQKKFIVNDPASDDGNINAQGPFTFETKNTSNITLTTEEHGVVTHARYTNWTGDSNNRRAVVDSMHQITPVFAGWPINGHPAATRIVTKIPWHFQDTSVSPQPPSEISHVTARNAVSWCYDAGEAAFYYADAAGQIFFVDPLEDTETSVATVSGSVLDMVVGGTSLDLYILSRESFQDRVTKVDRDTLRTNSRTLSARAAGIDYDSNYNGPAVLNTTGDTIFTFSPTLSTVRRQGLLGLFTDFPAGDPTWHFKIDHATGDALIAENGSNVITRYKSYGPRRIGWPTMMRGVTAINGLMPLDGGLIAIQDGNRLKTYDSFGRAFVSQLTNLETGGPFKMSRSTLAIEPGSMSGQTWVDVVPSGTDP